MKVCFVERKEIQQVDFQSRCWHKKGKNPEASKLNFHKQNAEKCQLETTSQMQETTPTKNI